MSNKVQLDVSYLSYGWRHRVNVYEEKAGIVHLSRLLQEIFVVSCCNHRQQQNLASPLCAPPTVTDRVAWSVGLSVGLSFTEPCKNSCSDRDVVCIDDSGGPGETPVAYSGPLQANIVLCSFNTIQPSSSIVKLLSDNFYIKRI